METSRKSWIGALFAYAGGEKRRLAVSVVLSVLSVTLGLVPFVCMYRLLCLFADGTVTAAGIVTWCLLSLAAYAAKIVLFTLSTGTPHAMAYTILEGLRLRLADRFLHAPLGNVENCSIGEIKSMMVDKIENLEPPLAHMIPEGAGIGAPVSARPDAVFHGADVPVFLLQYFCQSGTHQRQRPYAWRHR